MATSISVASDGGIVDHELEERWVSVKSRLSAVLRNMQDHPLKTLPAEWVDIYTDVAKLYNQNDSLRKRRMYVYVRQFIRDLVAVQLHHLRPLGGTVLLSEYVRRWTATMTYVKFMKRVLHHLHRFWIPDHANTLKNDPIRPLDKLLMFYWREDLLSSLHSVVDIALALIDDDRRGIPINHAAVRGIVDNFVEIGAADVYAEEDKSKDAAVSSPKPVDNLSTLHLYLQVFEERFLICTRKFYKEEGARIAQDGNITLFIKRIMSRLDEEERRAYRLLHKDSAPRIRQAAEEQLIGNHKEYLQKEANRMIEGGREDDLRMVYTLLKRIDGGLAPVRAFFVSFVRAEGNSIVVKHVDKMSGKEDVRHNLVLVELLVHLYLKHARMVKRCFEGANIMILAIDDAFRGFVNRSLGSVSLPNLLAHYVDHLLRSNKPVGSLFTDSEGLLLDKNGLRRSEVAHRDEGTAIGTERDEKTDSADEDPRALYLDELVRFFMYLDDKDLFFETHRRLFAKRLLTRLDEDMETLFITKLKVQMGNTYTQRLSGMLQDIMLSNTLREEFGLHITEKRKDVSLDGKRADTHSGSAAHDETPNVRDMVPALTIDFNGHVLNALHWPAVKAVDLAIPSILQSCQKMFSDFYMRSKELRKLTWIHSMSTVHLKGRWGNMNYTLVVSTFQACLLLLFNDREEMTMKEAASVLNISNEELRRHVKPLLAGKKSRVLEVKPRCDGEKTSVLGCTEDGVEAVADKDACRENSECKVVTTHEGSIGAENRDRCVENCKKRKLNSGVAQPMSAEKQASSSGGEDSGMGECSEGGAKSGEVGRERSNGEKGEDGKSRRAEQEVVEAGENDVMRVNRKFHSRHLRIVVASTMPKMASADAAVSRKNVVMDRSTQIDATVVRIMKSRKQMSHVALVAEVISQLSSMHFMPDPKLIKSRLERLIDQEYMIRDESDTRVYRYNT